MGDGGTCSVVSVQPGKISDWSPSPTDGQAQVQLLNGQLDSEPKALSSTGNKPQRAHSTAQDSPVIRAEHGDLGCSDSKRLGWQSTVKRNNRSVIETKRRKRS